MRFLIGSLLLHALILLTVSFQLREPQSEKVIVVEFKSPPVEKKISVVKRTGFSKIGKDRGGLSLFPKMDFSSVVRKMESRVSSDEFGADIGEVFGKNGNENWAFYQEIYRKIDSQLMFDSILAQYDHFGRVEVQFKIQPNGVFDLSGVGARSNDPILKVHALRAIRASLSEPLEQTKWAKNSETVLFTARFDFTFGSEENNFHKQKNFGRPVLTFNRSTLEKPVPAELLDQLLTGGVTPNISLMYERWQKYNKKKRLQAEQFDPFASYRKDQFYNL